MKTLREKINGLDTGHMGDVEVVILADVVRIIAEHEKDDPLLKIAALFNGWANAGAPDGGPANVTTAAGVLTKIGAALGDPFARAAQPSGDSGEFRRAETVPLSWHVIHAAWEDMAGDVVRVWSAPGGRNRMVRPRGATWSEVEAMAKAAEVPKWRTDLAKLQQRWDRLWDEQKHPGDLHSALMALRELAALAEVIASGKGEAVVPECVARAMGGSHPTGPWRWEDDNFIEPCWVAVGHNNSAGADFILAAIDTAGNALVGAS